MALTDQVPTSVMEHGRRRTLYDTGFLFLFLFLFLHQYMAAWGSDS
jgi:hypothetical protein